MATLASKLDVLIRRSKKRGICVAPVQTADAAGRGSPWI